MVTQQPFKPSYYRAICQLAIPENYDWRQFPRESPSKLSEKSRMPLQVALRHTERVLFGPFWRSYTGQIYGRNPAPTPFRTVSLGNRVNRLVWRRRTSLAGIMLFYINDGFKSEEGFYVGIRAYPVGGALRH